MSKDSFAQSAAYLKQAVPLMIKYQIPTTPNNYHLWYNYVSGAMPELNNAVDHAIKLQGTFSLTTCERLYHQHLASQDEQQMEAMKLNLVAMANELGHSMQDALVDTGQFQAMLDKSFDKLNLIDDEGLSLDDTMAILRELVRESRDVRMSTLHFRNQLSSAEKEIKELKAALNETRKMATEDALTSLLNRRAFDLEMDSLIRSKQPFSLIMTDIDRFKNFNDEYGHLLGDQVLRIVGATGVCTFSPGWWYKLTIVDGLYYGPPFGGEDELAEWEGDPDSSESVLFEEHTTGVMSEPVKCEVQELIYTLAPGAMVHGRYAQCQS